ncbi:MAG: (2Fe-2S)-binding protein [Pseudomonadota bacterium]
MTRLNLTVNQRDVSVEVDPATPLLDVLRNELGLVSPRFGCGQEQCGACRVRIGSNLIYACTTSVSEVAETGDAISTVEGLGTIEAPHPLQQAFMDLNAGQCGYCLSGIMRTASALLEDNPAPTRSEVMTALDPHLCRCGAHNRIIDAILTVAAQS